mgnify:CR=1 FL=1
MEICKAKKEDIPEILSIYEQARIFMRQQGNFSQGTGAYPGEETVLEDIFQGDELAVARLEA